MKYLMIIFICLAAITQAQVIKKEIPADYGYLVNYPLVLDPQGKIFYSYAQKGAGVTRNVIIDKTGKIVYMTRLFKQDEFDEMKQP